jgi:hypothetical protein
MAEQIGQLHTAIRRYCIENYDFWLNKYFQLEETRKSDNDYTDEAYSIFPRYNILKDILIEIERFQPKDFITFEEAKDFFYLISNHEDINPRKKLNNEIEEKVKNEERKKLYAYIHQLTDFELAKIESLFYRRVLSEKESQHLYQKLKHEWNVDGYWFPLTTWKSEDTEAFQDKYFEEEFGFEKLQQSLVEIGVEKVFEINEGDINYEMEISVFEPCYGTSGSEGFWFDESFEWLIYVSHESSITFSGSILPVVQKNWKNCQERIWTSPFFD